MLIAAIEALSVWMPRLTAVLGHRPPVGPIAAFDLGGKGSLAAWFSSLLLLAASLVAVLVYSVRRHQVDDYRGRYRVWLWAALCWFLMASDAAASLHEGFRDLVTLLTGTALLGDGSIWWVIGYALLLGAIGVRLLLDMWPCRLSTAALLAAGGAYAAAVPLRLGWLSVEDPVRRVMVLQGAVMGGHLLLLLAMGLHLRYVLADARGLLPPRREEGRQTKREKGHAKESRGGRSLGDGRFAARLAAAGLAACLGGCGGRAGGDYPARCRAKQTEQGRAQGVEKPAGSGADQASAAGQGRLGRIDVCHCWLVQQCGPANARSTAGQASSGTRTITRYPGHPLPDLE